MSYTRLVGNADHSEAKRKQFANQIIFFVIERGAAEMTDRSGTIETVTVFGFVDEGSFPRFPHALCDHFHRAVQRNLLPFFCARRAIFESDRKSTRLNSSHTDISR